MCLRINYEFAKCCSRSPYGVCTEYTRTHTYMTITCSRSVPNSAGKSMYRYRHHTNFTRSSDETYSFKLKDTLRNQTAQVSDTRNCFCDYIRELLRERAGKERERLGGNLHARAPWENLVLVAGDLESVPVLLQSNDSDVRESLLPYRLHQCLRHLSLSLFLSHLSRLSLDDRRCRIIQLSAVVLPSSLSLSRMFSRVYCDGSIWIRYL